MLATGVKGGALPSKVGLAPSEDADAPDKDIVLAFMDQPESTAGEMTPSAADDVRRDLTLRMPDLSI